MRATSFILLHLVGASYVSAQALPFPGIGNDTARAMSGLTQQAIATYKEKDRDRYLDNLFRMQMVAGRYAVATPSIYSLHALRGN
jgi:hypothetical protein